MCVLCVCVCVGGGLLVPKMCSMEVQTEKKNQRMATFVPHLPPLDIVTIMLQQCHISQTSQETKKIF